MQSVFLCHASEDKPFVEPIQLALASAGCKVFYDEQSLPPGGDYQARIRTAINTCDVFVFIGSPASITEGKFTLTELEFARERWSSPVDRVLPVATQGLKPRDLPSYLQAATVLTVRGNAAAEVRAAVETMLHALRPKRPWRLAATLTLVGAAIAVSFAVYYGQILEPCRDPSHGVEYYGKDFVVDKVSPWMGGGYDPTKLCADAIAGLKGEYPSGQFKVVTKSESTKNTCPPFNCPQYQYICKVRVQAEPVYKLKASAACK